MDPQSSGGSQLRFTALECALALHTLAELHGLLTHCALAELQNPVDTVAVTMVQMLLLAPLMRLARNGTNVLTAIQAHPLHHLNAILGCDTCFSCAGLQCMQSFSA